MTVQVTSHPPESGWWHLACAIAAHSTYLAFRMWVSPVSQDWLPGPSFSRSHEESLISHHHLLVTLGLYIFSSRPLELRVLRAQMSYTHVHLITPVVLLNAD